MSEINEIKPTDDVLKQIESFHEKIQQFHAAINDTLAETEPEIVMNCLAISAAMIAVSIDVHSVNPGAKTIIDYLEAVKMNYATVRSSYEKKDIGTLFAVNKTIDQMKAYQAAKRRENIKIQK